MKILLLIIIIFLSFSISLKLSEIDFLLAYIVGNRGCGKTLFCTLYAKQYHSEYPNNKIYSNYKLLIPNSEYHPFMMLNYSELDNCLIIIDDIAGIENFDYFIKLISNWSRKSKFHILLTGQYYTHFKKQLRTLAEFQVHTELDKINDILYIIFVNPDNKEFYFKIKKAIAQSKKIYNTNFKIPIANNSKLIELVKENSHSLDDIEANLSLYFPQRKITSLAPKLARQLGFIE